MITDKFLLLKRHVCSEGLSEEAIHEIAAECELIRVEPGEYLHRANQKLESVYLLIHGRVRQSVLDIAGRVAAQRFLVAGATIGALAAALNEPTPMYLVAEDPTTLLRLDYPTALELTKKHAVFQQNFSKLIAEAVLGMLTKDRNQKKPALVAVFHQSPATQPITQRLMLRLQQLGETPHFMSDQLDWEPIEGVSFFGLRNDAGYVPIEDVAKQFELWSDYKRAFIDVDAGVDMTRALRIAEICDKLFWCVTPENWQASLPRLRAIVSNAHNWRDKINVVWLLPGDSPWAPLAPEFRELAKRDFKMSLEKPPPHQSRELSNGLERIIHQLRGIRIGVALGAEPCAAWLTWESSKPWSKMVFMST